MKPREAAVLAVLEDSEHGLTKGDIAEDLGLSVHTVRSYLSSLIASGQVQVVAQEPRNGRGAPKNIYGPVMRGGANAGMSTRSTLSACEDEFDGDAEKETVDIVFKPRSFSVEVSGKRMPFVARRWADDKITLGMYVDDESTWLELNTTGEEINRWLPFIAATHSAAAQ